MDYKFEVSEQPAQPVLSIRTFTSVDELPARLGQAYKAIIDYLNEIGEMPLGAAFTAYYNLDMQNLDVEMGFPVAVPLAGKGEIKAGEIPAGKQVSYLHKGPYKGLMPAYTAMTRWIEKNGYAPAGVVYEFYYNSPAEVPESELLTKIVCPLSS